MASPRPLLLCFAGDVWDANPHSRHHLCRRFAAQGWTVLFVEGVPMRAPALGERAELGRMLAKLRARVGLREVAPHLHVLRPPPVPPAGRLGRAAQLASLRLAVVAAARRIAPRSPRVSWFSLPVAAPLRGRLGDAASVFYYQDRYDAFSHVDSGRLRAQIRDLALHADLTIASAERLAEDLRAHGADPLLVPHGVDLERFAADDLPAPADLDGLERPLVGYVGVLDDYLALGHMVATADALVRGTVVCVGAANADVGVLDHPRVRLLGRRPYEAVPAYLQAFACCLVPFAPSRLTDAVNPIKLREYLAAGRPVVSTPMVEVRAYEDVVAFGETPAAFAAAVLAALDDDSPAARARRRARVAADSWDAVAARIEPRMRALLA